MSVFEIINSGRGGEVATMTANSAWWCDVFDVLTVKWNQKKTGKQDIMNYFNDWINWEIDFYHGLAGYLMVGAGASNYCIAEATVGGNFIFPHLAGLKGSGAADKVTTAVRSATQDTQYDSTSLRSGAILTMVTHETTSMFHTAIRAGHDLSYEMGRSFEYIQCAERTVAVGGIALGGYVNSLVRPSRASLCFYSSLPETMQQTLDNLMVDLFFVPHIEWGRSRKKLFDCCLATILKSLDKQISKYGMDDIMVKRLLNCARKFGIDLKTLIYWGSLIADDFLHKNLPLQQTGAHHLGRRVELSNNMNNSHSNYELQRQLIKLQSDVDILKDQLRECLNLQRQSFESFNNCVASIRQITIQMNSPSKKQKRSSDGSPINDVADSGNNSRSQENQCFSTSLIDELFVEMPTTKLSPNDSCNNNSSSSSGEFLKSYDEHAVVMEVNKDDNAGTTLLDYVTKRISGRDALIKIPGCRGVEAETRERRRVVTVMKHLINLADEEEKKVLESIQPSRNSSLWSAWNEELKSVLWSLLIKILLH